MGKLQVLKKGMSTKAIRTLLGVVVGDRKCIRNQVSKKGTNAWLVSKGS